MERTFDWVQFPEGRARFAGNARGADELGHETFAVEVNSVEYFGEIDQVFLPDGHNFNVEIISFGWPGKEWVGMPMPGMCTAFTADEIRGVQALVVHLIEAGSNFEDAPGVLFQTPNSRFMGKVVFRDGWALSSSLGIEEATP